MRNRSASPWGRLVTNFWYPVLLAGTLTVGAVGQCQTAATVGESEPSGSASERIVLPESVPDPLEPFNRGVWAFNRGLMAGFVKPTSRAYRAIVPKAVRLGISNFGRNLTYPGRLANNLLEARWKGARDETWRFTCNTFVGAGGFVDFATRWGIPKADADFGQTFGQWGWRPDFYLMLPVYGPSNDRDAIGLAADSAANPLTYFSPYPFSLDNPLTYVSPYTYCAFGVKYNDLADSVDALVRFAKTEMDPYSELQYAWTFVRQNRVANFQVKGEPDKASLETLQSVFFSHKDPEFPNRGKNGAVRLPATGRKLGFTYWLQPQAAPVVYINPGLGSHRLSGTVLALAELVFEQGFSAVCVSSTFNHEFIERGARAAVPAYTPFDARDLHLALTEIDRHLRARYARRLGATALLGYSMGAFQALYLAGTESTNHAARLEFDRYVAINPPVRLLYGIARLDEFFQAPLAWPTSERTANIENTFLKVAALSQDSLEPQTSLPFDAIESEFLIGLLFRLTLRDAIYTSQQRYDLGVLRHPLSKWRRAPVYEEILTYSCQDYVARFLVPYYWMWGIDLNEPGALEKASDLRTQAAGLRANPKVRLVLNANDFLLPPEDLEWLQATFPADQITLFPEGGHLGNLSHPAVQKAIIQALEALKRAP